MGKIFFAINNALNVIDLIISLNLALSCHFSKRTDPADENSIFQVTGPISTLKNLQAELLKKQLPIGNLVES